MNGLKKSVYNISYKIMGRVVEEKRYSKIQNVGIVKKKFFERIDSNELYCDKIVPSDNVFKDDYFDFQVDLGKEIFQRMSFLQQRNRDFKYLSADTSSLPSNDYSNEDDLEFAYMKKVKNKKDSVIKAKRRVYELANCNPQLNVFLTLTYAENFQDRKKSLEHFNYFTRKMGIYMKKNFGKKFEYIAVLEYQKRGAIHYHLLCNFIPIEGSLTFKERKKINGKIFQFKTSEQKNLENWFKPLFWSRGNIDICYPRSNDGDLQDIGAYLCKYFTKDLDSLDFSGDIKKRYLSSKGLKRAVEFRFCEDTFCDSVDNPIFQVLSENGKMYNSVSYENFYNGSEIVSSKIILDDNLLYESLLDIEQKYVVDKNNI